MPDRAPDGDGAGHGRFGGVCSHERLVGFAVVVHEEDDWRYGLLDAGVPGGTRSAVWCGDIADRHRLR